MERFDFLIVGQGLAGSLLAYRLLKANKSVLIIDDQQKGAASAVAAGIINPITGRRFAKSWRIDEFLPYAKSFYQQLELELGETFFYERSVLRFLAGNKDINDWYARSAWDGFGEYMQEYQIPENFSQFYHLPFDIGAIKPAAQVDLPLLINLLKVYFTKNALMLSERFDYEKLSIQEEGISYHTFNARQIVFCEGYQGRFNPWFSMVPFEPAKGEVLILKIPGLNQKDFIKNKLMIAPLGDDHYWLGSNYEWNAPNDLPTESFKRDFIQKIKRTIKIPFEVIEHKAAIRPTIKDRRPVLGTHPVHPRLSIFNGLGTKGASLAPFWSNEMLQYLLHQQAIHPEADLQRFC